MDLTPYLESVRGGVRNAAALADEHTQQVADRLGGAVESSTRLALIQALSDAANAISAEIAPTAVELRMDGQDPEFVVTVPPADGAPTLLVPDQTTSAGGSDEPAPDLEDEPVARISLRLPQSVKARVDEMATKDGISTNAWLIRAVMDALADRGAGDWAQPPQPPVPPHPGVIFGPHGPFGPHGVFGPHGPFGPGGLFGEKAGRGPDRGEPPHPGDAGRRARGNVQGWVR